jgi:hypothetical protein
MEIADNIKNRLIKRLHRRPLKKFEVVTFEIPPDKETHYVFDNCAAFLARIVGQRKAQQLLKPYYDKYSKLKEPGYYLHVLII